MKLIQTLAIALAFTTALPLAATAHADGFPDKPIMLVIPFPPGGPTDAMARTLAAEMKDRLGQPMIVENRAGAGGNIGAEYVSRAAPDGQTLLFGTSGPLAINSSLYRKVNYDPVKSFAPVIQVGHLPNILVVNPSVPAKNVKELIAYAKANPGKLNYASSGNGSIQHIAGELFKQLTGTFITHIPYRGSGPAVQDLMGGQVDLFITTPAGVVSQIQGGRLKGIAVTSKQRLTSLPNVPTAAESGLNGYELDSWFALYAPAGTPADIVQQLNAEVNKILAAADTRKKADESGTAVEQMTPQQLGDFTKKELDYWGKVIKGAKITLE